MASSALVWELVKKNHAFIKKNLNGTVWSTEPGNLLNKHCYKYSTLANLDNTVGVEQSKDGDGVAILTSGKKKPGKLAVSVAKKPSGRRVARAAGAVAGSRRPDLKRPAQARASEIRRALRKKAAMASS